MHKVGKSSILSAGLIVLSLLLTATMAVAYGDGGGGNDGAGGSAGGMEEGNTQTDLSVSFGSASPSSEPANVDSFGGSTISRNGMAAIGHTFPEAQGANMSRHLESMGKTLEVLDRGRAHGHGGLTIVKGVPLVTGGSDPVESIGSPAATRIGGFTPANGPSAFERARDGSDPERNPEQATVRARVEQAVATAGARLAEAGVQPPAANTPSEAIAAAAQAVGAPNFARMPRYVPSATYAPGAGQ